MAAMGRPRKTPRPDLEPRVYENHGAFYYVHKDGRWEHLGADKEVANSKARHFNDASGEFGTMVYWLNEFLLHCEARVKAGTMSARTLADYTDAIRGTPARPPKGNTPARDAKPGALSVFFAPPMTPTDVKATMVQDFLDVNAELGRPVPSNREKACLSSCFSWLLRRGKVPGLQINPCLRGAGVKRNPESKRDLYVTHEDYRDVWDHAPATVRLMMELTYRTLQRPESDIIGWTSTVIRTERGVRILNFQQGKTKKWMKIAVPAELDALLQRSIGDVPTLRQPLVHNRKGEAYTYDGISAMLKTAIRKANAAREKAGRSPIPSFGYRDLKGKGATDMWLDRVPIEQIQALCGHEDKTTTEIYVKQRWQETIQPNKVAM